MSLYVIQFTGKVVGDAVLWWGPERNNYTTCFDYAGCYSETEARSIEALRGTDKAIPYEIAFDASSRTVLAQDLREALAAHERNATKTRKKRTKATPK